MALAQRVSFVHGFILIPPVGYNEDRSWFQRHLGLPDLVVRFQYLCSEFRRYNFGPGTLAFSTEMSRIREEMRRLEYAAYQLDYKRLFSSVVYDYEVHALTCVSQTLLNRIVGLHEMMFREYQKLMCKINAGRPSVIVPNPAYRSSSQELLNNERIATAGLYSSASELDNRGRRAGAAPGQQQRNNGNNSTTYGRFESGLRFMPYKSTPKHTAAQTMTTFSSHNSSWTNGRSSCFGIHSTGGCHICTEMPSQFSDFIQVPPPNANVRQATFHSIPEYDMPVSVTANMGRGVSRVAVTNVTWCNTTPICYPPQQRR